jgi:hypothetical protein
MSVFVIIIFLIIISWVYIQRGPRGESVDDKLVISQATDSSIIVRKGEDKYLIDDSDIKYYKDKDELIKEYNKEVRERGYKNIEIPLETIINEIIQPVSCIRQRGLCPVITRPLGFRVDRTLSVAPIDPLNVVEDTQNVHDTQIQSQLKKGYEKIKESKFNMMNSRGDDFNEDDILKYASELKKDTKVLGRILMEIKERDSYISNFGLDSEYKVLENTWKTGNDNVKCQIINNLFDCRENLDIVCPTGVASRIVESAFIDTPENMPRTKKMFVTEMLSKASLIRDTLEDSISSLDETEQTAILKRNILKSYVIDYKDILTTEEIREYTEDWIDYI